MNSTEKATIVSDRETGSNERMKISLRARRDTADILLEPKFREIQNFHFIVPVYRELKNGNLARLLENLAAQTQFVEKISLLLLVNNSVEVAANVNAPERVENVETLGWLKAQNPPFRLRAEDLATAGVERNMGKIRQRGVEIVGEAAHAEDVVIHLDADTRLSPDFLAKLHELYATYAELETVFFLRDYELRHEPSAELLHSHHPYRLKRAVLDFFNARTALSCGLATYQISSRLRALRKVGGFRPLPADEDTALTADLLRETNWLQAATIEMVTEDRARPDGFTAGKRFREMREFLGAGKFLPEMARSWGRKHLGWHLAKLRAASPQDFFLHHGLFHSYCVQIWGRVKSGEISFAEAVEKVRACLSAALKREIAVESEYFLQKSAAEIAQLPDDLVHDYGEGPLTLHPPAHPFHALVLEPTARPGSDLLRILQPHLSGEEQRLLAERLALVERAHDEALRVRKRKLADFLNGGPLLALEDVFLRWTKENALSFRRRVRWGWITADEAIAELTEILPDWLKVFAETPSRAEVEKTKAATWLLVRAQGSPGPAGVLAFTALLQDGGQPFRLKNYFTKR